MSRAGRGAQRDDRRARLAQDPRAERVDQAGLLGDRDELVGGRTAAERRVRPAQQRLDPDDLAGRELGDGLGDEVQLAAVPGRRAARASISSRRRRLRLPCTWPRRWRLPPSSLAAYIASSARRTPRGRRSRPGDDDDADAGGRRQAVGCRRLVDGADRGDDALGDDRRDVGVDVLGHDDELVATEACDGVARPDAAGDPLGDVAQDLVADVVADGVVDELEAVEVDEQDRERRAAAPCAGPARGFRRSKSSVRFGRPVSGSCVAR